MKIRRRILSVLLSVTMLVTSVVVPTSVKAEETQDNSSGFSNFITASGTKLMDGDKELKFVSLNYPQATSDTPWENANAMKTIRDMGGNVTRTYTIPVYNGENADTAYVTGVDADGKLTFNENALNALDNVLAAANKYGIRVVIPLVDHWHWIGGMDGYVWLAGESGGKNPSQSGFQDWAWKFYSSEKCMDYFKQMISHLLERNNTVTGVKYKDDKAILCWETGNEIGNRSQTDRDAELTAWTNTVVDHIKSIDKNHLVLDGRMSMSEKSLSKENHADILGAHYYEGNYPQRCEDDTKAAHAAGKPFILGEFGAKTKAQDCIDVFEKGRINNTNGIMMWSLRAHKDGYGYYFHNEDGYWASYHWPGFESGNYYGEKEIIRSIYAYAQIANGKAATYEEAKNIPIPAPETDEAPLLYAPCGTSHDRSFEEDSVGDIKWRGVVGGAWYEIQRADGVATEETPDVQWKTIADESDNVYDSGRNWEDKAHDCIAGYHDETAVDGQTYSYRLRACNESGVGLWSNIVTVNSAKHVVVDDLDLIAVSSDDANPTEIRNTYSSDHSANISYSSSSIVNKSDTEGYIEYSAKIPVDEISVTALAETEEDAQPKIMVSKDGISFEELTVSHESGTKVYSAGDVLKKGNYYYSRIYIAGQSLCKLDSITLTYKNDGKSDRPDAGEVKSNVMIQDNTFGENATPYYISKDENLAIGTTSDVKGLTATDDKSGTIIYKTGDDINAYRIVVNSKDGKNAKIEYSYDGVTYKDAAKISSEANGDFTRTVYGDLTVAETVRVIRITLPEGSKDKVFVESVELSSGSKSIPLADAAPSNTLEDGEYYFGSDENLAKDYTITSVDNVISFSKELGGVDFSAYDCLYAWIQPDNSNNHLALKLTDENGKTWTSGEVSLTGTTASMKKFSIDKDGEFNWKKVKAFAFVITGNAESATRSVQLDASNVYSGNYGVALNYTLNENESTVYVDSVYVSSSTKVDDFEGYSGSNTLLNQAYTRNTGGGKFDLSLDSTNKSEGSYGLRVDYDYNGTGYAGATKTMDLLNLAGYDGFTMFINSDGSGNEIKVQMDTDTSTYAYTGYMTGKGPMTLYMPFNKIVQPDWATSGTPQPIDSSQNLKSVSIYTNQHGSVTKGTFYVDDLKGANFKENLTTETSVAMDSVASEVTSFPYTISGEAAYVDYVALTVGDKVFNVPVKDGKWSYELTKDSGVYNGDEVSVKVGFYYPDGEAVKETEETKIKIQVEGNDAPIVESYDNAIWTWDFAADGTEGWSFEGFEPTIEDGKLVAWSQDGYNATFSYTLNNVPNGVYTLQNDIHVKSNMDSAYMILESGEESVKSTSVDTADVTEEGKFLGKKLTVTNNTITVKYEVSAPKTTAGVTFKAGNLKLYFVEGLDVIKNGDFSAIDNGKWPHYPDNWNITPGKNDAGGAIKTEAPWYESGNNKVLIVNPVTFSIAQDVIISSGDTGIYRLATEIDTTNGGANSGATINDLAISVISKSGEIVSTKQVASGTNGSVTLDGISLDAGEYTVSISGTLEKGNVYVDNVSLKLITPVKSGNSAENDEKNLLVNGDFEELGTDWPNLPVNWDTICTGGNPNAGSPIKGANGQFVGYADEGYAYTFELSQQVDGLESGKYTFSADMKLLNEGFANSVKLVVNDTKKEVKEDLVADSVVSVKLSDVVVTGGSATVKILGDFTGKGIEIDNVKLIRTGVVDSSEVEKPDNGDKSGDNSGGTTPGGSDDNSGTTTPDNSGDNQGGTSTEKKENPVVKSTEKYTKPIGSKKFKLVTDGKGKLSFKSSNKKVVTVSSNGTVTVKGYGKAVITVTAKGNEEYLPGVKEITITIVPKKASVKAVKPVSANKIKISWKKDTKATGYQIEYATKKDFSDATRIVVKNQKSTEKTISNLESGTKYYVRVREYKKSGKATYHGKWSSTKSVKTK